MKALSKLRDLLGANTVSYDDDEDGEGSPYYKITMRSAVPGYAPRGEEGEYVVNRKALGDAIRLKLIDFILGNPQRVNEESILLFDQSNIDYSRYNFEFQIPAENLENIEHLPLSKRTVEQAKAFTNQDTLLGWMEKQKLRNIAANRILFRRSDDEPPASQGWTL